MHPMSFFFDELLEDDKDSLLQSATVSLVLEGLCLEKYVQLFVKKAVKFDTLLFCNDEDLQYIGIEDEKDRKVILDNLFPLQWIFEDIYCNDVSPRSLSQLIGKNVYHLRTILGQLMILKKQIKSKNIKNIIFDGAHSSVSGCRILVEASKMQLDYINDDLKEHNTKKSFYRSFLRSLSYHLLNFLWTYSVEELSMQLN